MPFDALFLNIRKFLRLRFIFVTTGIIGFVGFVFLFRIIDNGSFWGGVTNCPFTEDIPVPPDALVDSTIKLESTNVFVAKGKDRSRCSPILASVRNEIVSGETISSVGEKYFNRLGTTIEPLPVNKTFTFEKVIAVSQHGLSAIDAGEGPLFYVLMRDERGVEHLLPEAYMNSSNEEKPYFGYYHGDVRVNSLHWECFEYYYSDWPWWRGPSSERETFLSSCWPGQIPTQ